MEYQAVSAASRARPSLFPAPASAAPACVSPVWLRLVQGESVQPVWMARSDETLRVGTSPECDWQVLGDDVAPVAFYLRVIAGELFVCASGDCEVLLDGQRLGAMWVPAEKGARLTLGSCFIEVGLSGRSRNAQSAVLHSASLLADLPAHIIEAEATECQGFRELDSGLVLRGLSPSAALRAALSHEPQQHHVPHAFSRSSACSSADVANDVQPAHCADQEASATILETDTFAKELANKPWASTGIWIAGSIVAGAYGCWVLLLDFM